MLRSEIKIDHRSFSAIVGEQDRISKLVEDMVREIVDLKKSIEKDKDDN